VQLYDAMATSHMILFDVDEEELLLPGDGGVLQFGYGEAAPRPLAPRTLQVMKIYSMTAAALMPIAVPTEPLSSVDGEKVKVGKTRDSDKDKGWTGLRVGDLDIIKHHLTWAKRVLGAKPTLLYVAPALPVLLELDGELRGFIMGTHPQPYQMRMRMFGPGIEV
jgi:hypothetical protein